MIQINNFYNKKEYFFRYMEHLENYDKNNMENMLNNLEEKYYHSY